MNQPIIAPPATFSPDYKSALLAPRVPGASAPSEVASPSGALAVPGGSARSGYEIIQSLKREGWTEDWMPMVFKSRDGQWAKVVWPDGKTAEARIEPNASDEPRPLGAVGSGRLLGVPAKTEKPPQAKS